MRASSAFSVCISFEEREFIFQFFNNKMHSYVLFDIIVHFNIQKLKNKHTFLKKYTNWESWGSSYFDRTRGDKNQIFRTLISAIHNWMCVFSLFWSKKVYFEAKILHFLHFYGNQHFIVDDTMYKNYNFVFVQMKKHLHLQKFYVLPAKPKSAQHQP